MKYLITGVSGQLGYDIVNELEKRNIFSYFVTPDLRERNGEGGEERRYINIIILALDSSQGRIFWL